MKLEIQAIYRGGFPQAKPGVGCSVACLRAVRRNKLLCTCLTATTPYPKP